MPHDEFYLENDTIRLAVRPSLGGSISALNWRGPDGTPVPILRSAPAHTNDPLEMACFPLFPFSNRIENARLTVDGKTYGLPVNFPPEPHCIHGDAWQSPWSLDHQSDSSATINIKSDGLGQPFHYAASQEFVLSTNQLTVNLTLQNIGSSTMPAGFGLHPYFDRTPGVKLQTGVQNVWLADETLIPNNLAPVPGFWDFTNGKVLDDVEVDNNFTGWNGTGLITWPGKPISVRVTGTPNLKNTVIFVPPGEDYFCFEPVSNENNAMNAPQHTWDQKGVANLEPNESITASITFEAVAASLQLT